MNSIKSYYLYIILLLSLAGCSGGGGSGVPITHPPVVTPKMYSIAGEIRDYSTNLPIAGVAVTIEPVGKTIVTAADGKFTFNELENGAYLITPSMPGMIFLSPSVTVTVDSANIGGVKFHGSVSAGQVMGLVADTGGSPLSPVQINVYDSSSGSLVPITTITNEVFGSFSIYLPKGIYRLQFSKNNFKTADYLNVEIKDNETSYLEMIFMIHNSFVTDQNSMPLKGDASGRISSALDGLGVSGLTVNLREGINASTGTIVATTTTYNDGNQVDPKFDGFYTFTDSKGQSTLAAGNYTAEVLGTVAGKVYTPVFFSVKCLGNKGTENQNMTVAPNDAVGLVRIVLTWFIKRDLDSHLTGPSTSGSKFHIYYGHKSDVGTTASLDVDNTVAYGPETTTIPVQISGVYRFSVHDFTGKSQVSTNVLSLSGAQVRVYSGATLLNTFNVPPGKGGTLWTVFEMDGATKVITPVNMMTYKADEAAIP